MDAISALKRASAPMNFKSFAELPVGEYVARKFCIVKSKFGPRVRVHIDDYFMYLPERHAVELDEKLIEILNNNIVMLKYMGKDPRNQNRLLIDFDLIKVDSNGEMTTVSLTETDTTTINDNVK